VVCFCLNPSSPPSHVILKLTAMAQPVHQNPRPPRPRHPSPLPPLRPLPHLVRSLLVSMLLSSHSHSSSESRISHVPSGCCTQGRGTQACHRPHPHPHPHPCSRACQARCQARRRRARCVGLFRENEYIEGEMEEPHGRAYFGHLCALTRARAYHQRHSHRDSRASPYPC
jgi:hypothetical protein